MLFNESERWATFPLCWHLVSHRSTVLPFPSLQQPLQDWYTWNSEHPTFGLPWEEWMPSNSRSDPSSPARWPVPLGTSTRSCKEITGHPTFMSCQCRITAKSTRSWTVSFTCLAPKVLSWHQICGHKSHHLDAYTFPKPPHKFQNAV